ncbi:PSRC1 protein, partial [Piaya cayana]|nr:PSRC1 protein [Piaya cayana]
CPPPEVRFITEESFDFGVLSPDDSREEEEGEEGAGGAWSPLSGSRLEEMMREAAQLAAQLEQCRLPPPGTPGTP